LRAYELDLGIPMQQGWGMTETSPLGTTYCPYPGDDLSDYDSTVQDKLYAGRRIFGVDMRIVDDEGTILPQDGEATGHLHVRGPWIASGYFKGVGADSFTDDGWFATGDVAAIHPRGYMEITDRSKDVIKSGGEWVSSEIKDCIAAKCAKWWMPDAIVFVDELPLGATGKILKRELKAQYKDFDLETAS